MSLRRIMALVIKEFYQIIRDPSSILISMILPLILLFLYGYGVSLDADHIKLGLVLEDTSPTAQSFVESLTNSRYFDVRIERDIRPLIDEMTRGNIRGIVVIPTYFSSFRNRQDNIAPIQVIADGTEPNTANFVQNYVLGAWLNWLQQQSYSENLRGLPLVQAQPRYWYNAELESRNFLIPGSLAIIMTLIGTLLTALVVAREWERGTMEALMSTPVSIVEILIGKLVPYFILGMVSMAMSVIVAKLVYQIPYRGSWINLGLVSSVFLFAALGLGLLISTLSKNQFVAAQASIVASFLPAFILSGFIFEITSMPIVIQYLTYLLPARYLVSSLQTLFLVGDVWEVLLPNLLAMFLLGLFLFILTARFTVKRLD